MPFDIPVSWPENAADAIALQKQLRAEVRLADDFAALNTVAGVDVSYDLQSNLTKAVVVLMKIDELHPLQTITATLPTSFPYVPGLLSFREIPALLQALNKLDAMPDVLMVDGQGVAHPRRLGIAAHLGVLTNLPALGVAKSRLWGRHVEVGNERGNVVPLMDKAEMIGTVLRSKPNTNPLYISAGHRLTQKTALDLTLRCLRKHRLPEPTRMADKISKEKGSGGGLL